MLCLTYQRDFVAMYLFVVCSLDSTVAPKVLLLSVFLLTRLFLMVCLKFHVQIPPPKAVSTVSDLLILSPEEENIIFKI